MLRWPATPSSAPTAMAARHSAIQRHLRTTSRQSTVARSRRAILERSQRKLMAPDSGTGVRPNVSGRGQSGRCRAAGRPCSDSASFQRSRARSTGIVSAIEDGEYSRALSDRLTALEASKRFCEARLLKPPPRPPVGIHPRHSRGLCSEGRTARRGAERPGDQGRSGRSSPVARFKGSTSCHAANTAGVEAVLHGDLARILALCERRPQKKTPRRRPPGGLLSVVAGTGFEPVTFRL